MANHGIYQTTLFVDDMAAMVTFYRDVMELTVQDPKDNYTDETWVVLQAGQMRLALHDGGVPTPIDGAPQISFLVDDVAGERQRLLDVGVQVSEIVDVAPRIQFAMLQDPEGNKLSIDDNGYVMDGLA